MSFTRLSGAVLAGLLLAGGAWAQQTEVAPAKIAFVYVQKALASTDEGKARLKDLNDWAQPRQDELAKLDKEVNDLKGQIMSQQGVASDDAIAELNRQLVTKRRQFEDRQRDAKRDFEAKQQTILRDIGGKLQDVINDVLRSEPLHGGVHLQPRPARLPRAVGGHHQHRDQALQRALPAGGEGARGAGQVTARQGVPPWDAD